VTKLQASSGLTAQVLTAVNIELLKSSNILHIKWEDGYSCDISGDQLRQYCPCAHCRSRKHFGDRLISISTNSADKNAVTTNTINTNTANTNGLKTDVETISLMGGVGLQVIFKDGHDRGIYPWGYLHAISQGTAMEFLNE
jgi:DUF971 family protein